MTRAYPVFSAVLALTCGAGLILAGLPFARTQLARTEHWRQTSMMAPEGHAAEALFDRAVTAGVIAWDPQVRAVILRRDLELADDLSADLFRIGEAGKTISAELRRARDLNQLVALRHRVAGCTNQCPAADWQVAVISPDAPPDSARALALGASQARPAPDRPPSPRLHAALSRDSGVGFGPWQTWTAGAPLTLSADLPDADRVDLIGRLDATPSGWKIAQRWCRLPQGKLTRCTDPKGTAAVRLVQAEGAAGNGRQARLTGLMVSPVPLLPARPKPGKYRLTEYIELICEDESGCVPRWVPLRGLRPYARPPEPTPLRAGADPAPVLAALGPWGDATDAGVTASDLVRSLGAQAVIGQEPVQPGSLLSALTDLPAAVDRSVTLHPTAQRIAEEVVTEVINRTGAFGSMAYRFPTGGAMTSLVVLDLRADGAPGAILAAAGRPAPAKAHEGSPWDIAAALLDGAGPQAGAAAWTGRGSHHTPASVWKMITALSLIDAATDPDMPAAVAAELAELIRGTDRIGAAQLLPAGVLEASGGICPPRSLTGDTAAANENGCGPNHMGAIRDNGRGGPLALASDTAVFGLTEAVAKSSNIWFTALLLKAEAAWHAAGHPVGGRLALTAGRLGLLDPLPLDGGLGLDLLPRDPASVEALEARPPDMGMLARAAFGQRVQAGPLITAQIAGAIATGHDLRPILLAPVPHAGPLFDRPEAVPHLADLRRGLQLAVQSRDVNGFGRGTAYPYFANVPAIQTRAFGKTGTGERGRGLDRLSTFAGWLEDPAGQPLFAIGCSATVQGVRTATGISVPSLCQIASVALMVRLDAEGIGP